MPWRFDVVSLLQYLVNCQLLYNPELLRDRPFSCQKTRGVPSLIDPPAVRGVGHRWQEVGLLISKGVVFGRLACAVYGLGFIFGSEILHLLDVSLEVLPIDLLFGVPFNRVRLSVSFERGHIII